MIFKLGGADTVESSSEPFRQLCFYHGPEYGEHAFGFLPVVWVKYYWTEYDSMWWWDDI